jgi:hypothetical protein
MKRFLVKISVFLFPIILIHLLTYFFYTTDQGDLLRVGYVWDGLPKTKLIMDKHMQGKRNFARVLTDKLDKKYTVLTIGDSFSELDSFGYQNYLGEHKDLQILHIDQRIHNNDPFQFFSNLLNGDFFDSLNVQFVVLQSVERYITGRGLNLDTNKKMMVSALDSLTKKINGRTNIKDEYKFFSNRVLKFISLNFLYLFDDNAYYSEVYKTKLNGNYFTSSKKDLLFVYDDLNAVKMNNEMGNVVHLNNVLNDLNRKLNKRGIQLIFLPAPDKYDFYYEQLVSKAKYPKPLFFEHFNTLRKEYLIIDSKKVLTDSMFSSKDIYQYGDTHWSPNSSKFISEELYKVIKANE